MAITEKLVIEGDTTDAQQSVKKLGRVITATAEKAGRKLNDLGDDIREEVGNNFTKSFVSATAAIGVFNKAIALGERVVGTAIKNAGAYIKTTEQLRSALQSAGAAVDASNKLLDAQSSELQGLTGVSDDVIRSLQAQAIAQGVASTRVDEFVRAAFRLSNVTGQDVTGAFRQLLKTLSGLAGELGEANPIVRTLTEEQLRAGDAARVLNAQFSDMLDIGTRGLPGQLTSLANAFDDLTEAIAVRLAPDSGFGVLRSLIDDLNDLTLLVQRGGLQEALLVLGDFASDVLFFFPGVSFLNQKINDELDERIRLLREQAEAERLAAEATILVAQGRQAALLRAGGPLAAIPTGGSRSAADRRRAESIGALGAARGIGAGLEEQQQEALGALLPISAAQGAIEPAQTAMLSAALDDRFRLRQEHARQVAQLDQEQFRQSQQLVMRGTGILASFVTQAISAALADGDFVFSQFVKEFLKATGQQLIGSGVQHALQGAAMAALGLPNGLAVAAIGGAEIAAGTAMLGGQILIPAAARSAGGAGGGGQTTPQFGGGGAAAVGGGAGGGGARNITIVFNGPTTKPEVGLAIREALDEAEALGV